VNLSDDSPIASGVPEIKKSEKFIFYSSKSVAYKFYFLLPYEIRHL
jgi:hypothetical protein